MKRLITSVLVLACLVAAPLSAQTDQTGVLEGTVQDAAGGAIALADVRIALEDGSYLQVTQSDASGVFRLGLLKPVNNQVAGNATTLFGVPRFRVMPRNLRLISSLRFF